MGIKEFADMLNGREYGYSPFTNEEIKIAKENKFVIVYGASDDLVEFDGYYREEAGCFDGGIVTFDKNGTSDDGEEHQYKIAVFWCGKCKHSEKEYEATWKYETDIPHATFYMMEDGEKYCKAMVLDVSNLDL